jgi:hypothetical protein
MKRLVILLVAIGLSVVFIPSAQAVRPPGRPGEVAGIGLDSAVQLSWRAPRGSVDHYRVRFRADGGWLGTISTGDADTSFTIGGLANGTPYVFQVRAVNRAGRGPWSRRSEAVAPVAAVVPSPAPTDIPSPEPTRTRPPRPTPTPTVTDTPTPPAGDVWSPTPGAEWQLQLSSSIDTKVNVPTFDVDGADVPKTKIDTLHANGAHVICYFSAGSYEEWRDDADAFPRSVIGKPLDGWEGENWLDVRALDVLLPIMEARIANCAAKGFDAVDPDNVDGYTNDTGFPLTGADQIAYNKALADLAHKHGMSVGLKNDVDQIDALEPFFDFVVNEQCHQYQECGAYSPFVDAGKAVLNVEYRLNCPANEREGFSTMLKTLRLGPARWPCP